MVGQIHVERLDPYRGHVTPDTSRRRVDRAGAESPSSGRSRIRSGGRLTRGRDCRGVAYETFGLVLRGTDGAGTLVRIVAGHAAKRSAAFGIAAAASPADSLRADPTMVVRFLILERFSEYMAFVALFDAKLLPKPSLT